jgi:hypothetical protein
LTCNCDAPHDAHGNPGHLTMDHVIQSARQDGISLKKAAKRIRKAIRADRSAHPEEHR